MNKMFPGEWDEFEYEFSCIIFQPKYIIGLQFHHLKGQAQAKNSPLGPHEVEVGPLASVGPTVTLGLDRPRLKSS